jgi:predicted TIM-barrel fold metal-dependent hydrolase
VFGQALCRSYNSWLAETCDRSNGKLKWVTVIDPGDPAGAAREIERTKRLGSIGVMVLGMVGDKSIADPQFAPIWNAAAEADLGVAVHVGYCCPPLDNLYDSTYSEMVVPFAFTMLMAFEQILSSGLLDRHPNLRVAFLEAGCQWVPFMMERLEERLKVNPGYKGQLKPDEYVRRGNIFFGCEVEEDLLSYCAQKFGADRFLYASDIPHGDRILNSTRVLRERSDLSEADKDAILLESTAKFYKLPVAVANR